MNFSSVFLPERIQDRVSALSDITENDVRSVLSASSVKTGDFSILISSAAENLLEEMAQKAQMITRKRFGKVIQLYIPLYLSSICHDQCLYCGFRQDRNIKRLTLSPAQVMEESAEIRRMGFSHILLVSGTAPREVSISYLENILFFLSEKFSSIGLEVYSLAEDQYRKLISSGADSLTLYQETYYEPVYRVVHPGGTKKNFQWRMDALDRAGKAGMRKLNCGSLLGLHDWRFESFALYDHIRHLYKQYWESQISLSFPRITNHPDDFSFDPVSDKDMLQMICAFRIAFPDLNLVVSTREKHDFRMHLLNIAATQISAGSLTTVGGYKDGRKEQGQFAVEDQSSPEAVAKQIREMGFEPVWKDWESVLK